ncbi:type II toxin-antitoxin system CcdA family antitoxin [Enterobacter asburiae]|nr:type II toxin-antitoxin system CcdA family antitoxin [Enterobacter asburiae]
MRMNTTPRPRKKSTNISLDVSLVEEAKTLNINLSSTLNSALEDVVRLKRQAMWREENKTAIEASNRFVEEHLIPRSSDGLRVIK